MTGTKRQLQMRANPIAERGAGAPRPRPSSRYATPAPLAILRLISSRTCATSNDRPVDAGSPRGPHLLRHQAPVPAQRHFLPDKFGVEADRHSIHLVELLHRRDTLTPGVYLPSIASAHRRSRSVARWVKVLPSAFIGHLVIITLVGGVGVAVDKDFMQRAQQLQAACLSFRRGATNGAQSVW
jgi:hypothetical protein